MSDDHTLFDHTLQEALLENDRIVAESAASDARIQKLRQQIRRDDPERQIVHQHREQQSASVAISAEQDRAFNIWWTARFKRTFDDILKPAIAEFASTYVSHRLKEFEKKLRDDLQREIKTASTRLPVIRAYQSGLCYEAGEIVLAGSGVYQAQVDTHERPGSKEWRCICAPGRDGQDGRDGRDWDDPNKHRSITDLSDFRRHNGHG